MEKDFQEWHNQKRHIEHERPRVFFKEREIWLCHLGENIGFEQDGREDGFLRPIIVLKKFFAFSFNGKEVSVAILSQIRLVDAKRLKYKMGDMREIDFGSLKAKIRQLLV